MKRAIGVVVLIIGVAPVAAFLLWASRSYVVSIDVDTRGKLILAAFVVTDVACILFGLHLIRRSR